ncbi:gamma-interferon-responsive lysosomal thiol protein-like [Lolium rigidum]|uniref:gamma-interferon-responsive lysosomal thiol protein-like n=1 Tax=Lolium rigidum TaxID=89674 RepID=UPI001F5CB61B|nr:gamma-interferon-responsive lysosomal thiol protein-like [Lolium rigidum]
MAARPHHFLLLAAFLQLLATTSASTAGDIAATSTKKVRVEVYYESLCPYSARFVVNQLARAFKDGLLDGADVTFVPYGNAKVGASGAMSCQHGSDECLLNTVEACAIDAWPDVNVHFGLIYCIEDMVVNNRRAEWESCFQKQGLDASLVTKCYRSGHGARLALQHGRQTAQLVPPHKFVPWVVVDGKPLYNDYRNFESYVCKAYKGNPPKACQGLGDQYPIIQQVVEPDHGVVGSNSGDIEPCRASDGGAEENNMVLADGDV